METVEHCETGKLYPIEFVVVETDGPPLLGVESCEEMNLVKRVGMIKKEEFCDTMQIEEEFSDVFSRVRYLPEINNTAGCISTP